MRKYILTLLMLMPLMATAQDNTWERAEVEPVVTENPDAKYLAENAVPFVNDKVCFTTTIEAKGKTADQIYQILYKQMDKMTKEANQIENSLIVINDEANHELAAVFHEWLVFKNTSLSLDRTRMNFHLLVSCSDGKAVVKMTRISYDYETTRKPEHYVAEEWISDKYAVNKKRTKLYPISGKFRRKTIDRKDYIFNKFSTLLNE